MTPKLFGVDVSQSVQAWSNRLAKYLDEVRSVLQFKTADSKATQDGVILYDPVNEYPVVTVDGKFRQVVLSDGKFSGVNTANITASAVDTAYTIDWNSTPLADGITESNGVITFQEAGVYMISFSAQLYSNSSSSKTFWFFPRVNGTDVVGSTIKAVISENSETKVMSRTALFTFSENDTIEAMWAVDSTDAWLNAASSESFAPSAPSATINIVRICR